MSLAPSRTRVLDIVLAVLGLAVLGPILILPMWALIRVTSHGPGIYRQTRLGRNRQPFVIYKLRTMRHDPQDVFVRCENNRDPRITRIGRHLRRYRIDELPQLVNVLRGQMSFVGPRPFPPPLVARFDATVPGWETRFVDRPGLTSYGTLKGKKDADRLQYDADWVGDDSITSYVYVLGLTLIFLTGPGRWRARHRTDHPALSHQLAEAPAA